MSILLAVKGGKIKLEPNPDWAWQDFNGEITLDATHSLLSVKGKPVVINTDFPQNQNVGKKYTTPIHSKKAGTVQSFQLFVEISTLNTQTFSEKCVTEKTTGQFQATVSQPALTAKGDPDPTLVKTGQWSVAECGQEMMAVEAAAPQSLFLKNQNKQLPTDVVPSHQQSAKAEEESTRSQENQNLVEHIIVLVAGTVDPFNIFEKKRAYSYNYDLKLMSIDSVNALPTEGRCLVVVAKIGDSYHARIFDNNKKQLIKEGKDEFSPDQTLIQQLEVALSSQSIDQQTKSKLLKKITSSLGYTNFYWDTGDFFKQLEKYKTQYPRCHFFKYHGWTGDNAVLNRQVAGAYLADRWCGSNCEKPYYPAFKDRTVYFHLIGHSHGGNVINEITRRMAKNSEWSEKWKVKTIVYLSTPFCQELHQVNTAKFHENCKVVNVFNKYDLTQRMIANFSLKPFPELKTILDEKTEELINHIKKFDVSVLRALREEPSKFDILVKATLHILSFKLVPVELDWFMKAPAGKKLYTECGKLFSHIVRLLDEVQRIVKLLNTEVELKLAKGLKGKVPSQRQIISDALRDRLLGELSAIQKGLAQTIEAFGKRMAQDKYPMLGFFDDINDFITPIVDLLSINSENLTGKLSDLIHDVLFEQIDRYDNTTNSPDQKLIKKYQSISVDVTDKDPYSGKRDQQFESFITQIEKIEARYAQNRAKQDLLDMVFTLIAQLDFIHNNLQSLSKLRNDLEKKVSLWDWIDWCIGKENTHFENTVNKLIGVLKSYLTIFQKRNFGGIVVEFDQNDPKMGDLNYLMRISHSISRLELYEEVAKVLEEQIGTS